MPMSTARLFLHITTRATASGIAIAVATQALAGALFAAFGIAAAAGNGRTGGAAGAVLGVLFLGLVGAIAGGLFSIPMGIFIGVTSGILMSTVTRLFFHPPRSDRAYARVLGAMMATYTVAASWLIFMAVFLLFAKNHTLQSPVVPWLALLQASIAGALGYFVAGWIARGYVESLRKGADRSDAGA